MYPRRWLLSIALFAALVALVAVTGTPSAWAASPSPSPLLQTVPDVTGTIPNPKDPKNLQNWTGDRVQVNFRANGTELDLEACQLFINGAEQPLSAPASMVPAVSRATSSVLFRWDTAYPAGSYEFRAVLVTTTGEQVEYSWSFGSEGEAGAGSLVSFKVMQDWFWFIARGAVITV